MIKIDMWYGNIHIEADKIDIYVYPNDGEYRGNIYKNGKIICRTGKEISTITI